MLITCLAAFMLTYHKMPYVPGIGNASVGPIPARFWHILAFFLGCYQRCSVIVPQIELSMVNVCSFHLPKSFYLAGDLLLTSKSVFATNCCVLNVSRLHQLGTFWILFLCFSLFSFILMRCMFLMNPKCHRHAFGYIFLRMVKYRVALSVFQCISIPQNNEMNTSERQNYVVVI